jgi:hypothetical protein
MGELSSINLGDGGFPIFGWFPTKPRYTLLWLPQMDQCGISSFWVGPKKDEVLIHPKKMIRKWSIDEHSMMTT